MQREKLLSGDPVRVVGNLQLAEDFSALRDCDIALIGARP